MVVASVKSKKKPKSCAMTSTLRCFQVLELFAEEPFELSASDIADIMSTPKATAHRMCTTLVESGFIERVPASKRYRLTPKSLRVGSGYLRHSAIYRAAFFPMQALSMQIPGTVQLGVLSEGRVLFIHSAGYSRSIDEFADVGLQRVLHATAAGKLFLADLPLDEVEQLMSHGAKQYTGRTIVTFARMKKELLNIAAKGYAVNDEELLPGYYYMAAPVYDASGTTVATISITISADRAHREEEASYAALLCEAALKTSIPLGYSPPLKLKSMQVIAPSVR
jgi:DNA-binding IclR family transcriptional regulator